MRRQACSERFIDYFQEKVTEDLTDDGQNWPWGRLGGQGTARNGGWMPPCGEWRGQDGTSGRNRTWTRRAHRGRAGSRIGVPNMEILDTRRVQEGRKREPVRNYFRTSSSTNTPTANAPTAITTSHVRAL